VQGFTNAFPKFQNVFAGRSGRILYREP